MCYGYAEIVSLTETLTVFFIFDFVFYNKYIFI